MTCRVLAIWYLMSVAISATGQVTPDSVVRQRKFTVQVGNAIAKAFPRYVYMGKSSEDGPVRASAVLQPGHFHTPRATRVDSSRPNACSYFGTYTVSQDSVTFAVYINPKEEAISFDVTKDFEVLDIEGIEHGIRGNQQFVQTRWTSSYDGPFTALFIGRFTMPYSQRFPNREGGGWGPDQFITTTTYTAYDVSKDFLDVQSIYILFQGDPELVDKIVERMDLGALNGLISK
jgi:hypothetical protein